MHKEGEVVAYNQFVSASTVIYNDKANVRIIIENAHKGADLTKINKAEKEVLYPTNCKFKVLQKYFFDGILYLKLEEV